MNVDARPLVVVIDDRQDIVRFCERCLGDRYAFRHALDGRAAATLLRAQPAAAVLLDRDFSQADPERLLGPRDAMRDEGLHILRWLRHEHPDLPVVMVTGQRDLATALAAADLGADFLAWEDVTADPASLAARLQQALERRPADNAALLAPFRRLGIVAESPAFMRALSALSRALPGRAPILLLGPTGAGKDTLAGAVHALAGDPARPYVEVNVAALNQNLVESELFGHARGAFTGAHQAVTGKLRAADGGTLFLNEIGDLPLETQAKLLMVLERSEVVPVGEVRAYPAQFRLVTATSRDLRALVAAGEFRRDLLHRIAGHTIELPPLRERTEDIPALANAFLRATAAGRAGHVMALAREALEYLESLPWEGNVRELLQVIEAAGAQARHTVTVADVHAAIRRKDTLPPAATTAPAARATDTAGALSTADAADALFKGRNYDAVTGAYYHFLVRTTGGQMTEAARLAGISKTTIYEWRKRYGGGG